MPYSYSPADNEWASATGSNVYSGGSTSQFDYPPNAMYDMLIQVDPNDPDPGTFSIGDTVDISYSVIGINVTLEDAVVIRSDAAPNGGGVIVFEGMNNFGQIEHLVWTPEFDLEGWYWDNFSGGQPPGFWVTDTNPGYSHSFVCFASDTHIETPNGPVLAGSVSVGDLLNTSDSGVAFVRWIGRRALPGVGNATPIEFEPGAYGNHRSVRVSQQHRILVHAPAAKDAYGCSEVLVPAKALVDGQCVRYAACSAIEYVHFLFDNHEILSAEGLHCESLFLGKMTVDLIDMNSVPTKYRSKRMTPARPCLTYGEAIALLRSRDRRRKRRELVQL